MSTNLSPEAPNDSIGNEFVRILKKFMVDGVRPQNDREQRKQWYIKMLAEKVNAAEHTVRNWLNGQTVPRDIRGLENALLGDKPSEDSPERAALRAELRAAHMAARERRPERSGPDAVSPDNRVRSQPNNNTTIETLALGDEKDVTENAAQNKDAGIDGVRRATSTPKSNPLSAPKQLLPSSERSFVDDTTRLPNTAYKELRGRELELKRLDQAWNDPDIHVQSIIAWGGAGKTAFVTKWVDSLKLRDDHGAEAILAWSFYNQGTKERSTSSDTFIDWLTARLNLDVVGNGIAAKAKALEQALSTRRILIILDGVEPLQYGTGPRQGEFKDLYLGTLLRRLADCSQARSLILVTSRLRILELARWENTTAPMLPLEKLSDEAGTQLLKDRGVKGSRSDFRAAVRNFDGHALALTLLAGFLVKRHHSDVRRYDRIRALLTDDTMRDEIVHGHARRVLISINAEWFADAPLYRQIMGIVGLFNRTASADCLAALREKPVIEGVTDEYARASRDSIADVIYELREVGLLAQEDTFSRDSLSAHPLVREWFGSALRKANEEGWRQAHRRLYVYLRDETREGDDPGIDALEPLFQAIPHGCQAGMHQEVFDEIYIERLCRVRPDKSLDYYVIHKLGATGELFGAIIWLFEDHDIERPVRNLSIDTRSKIIREAGICLSNLGRLEEALPCLRAALERSIDIKDWVEAAIDASNLSEIELTTGAISRAIESARRGVEFAIRCQGAQRNRQTVVLRGYLATAYAMAGNASKARELFLEAEEITKTYASDGAPFNRLTNAQYCWLLIDKGAYNEVLERVSGGIDFSLGHLVTGFETLNVACAMLGIALLDRTKSAMSVKTVESIAAQFDNAIYKLKEAGIVIFEPLGYVARARFLRTCGMFADAERDLTEAEEKADRGPMCLQLCDIGLERARLALAEAEGFVPFAEAPAPSAADPRMLFAIAGEQLARAQSMVGKFGYHRRDAECAELAAIVNGDGKYADLPPRVW